jgi:metal-dependent HD superfamily phosphatase/phosphodiesterase
MSKPELDATAPPVAAPQGPASPRDAIADVAVHAPSRGNRRLEALLDAANGDDHVKGLWHMQQVFADRLGMSDHSWVHIQVVLNVALRLFRLLAKRGVEPAMVTDHLMRERDAEVVIAAACLFHDSGMSIHRTDHESYSLFLAAEALPRLLADVYSEPERTVIVAEALHAIIGHRRRGDPMTIEAGSSASPTRSTSPRAARASRSRTAARTSTRCPPRRSTASRSRPATSAP